MIQAHTASMFTYYCMLTPHVECRHLREMSTAFVKEDQ